MVKVIVFRIKLERSPSGMPSRMSGNSQVDETTLKVDSWLKLLLNPLLRALESPVGP